MILWFETKLEKFGGPLKDLCGPPEGRGPPVEKHWFRERKRAEAHVSPPPAGQVNAHARAAATAVAATAQVKVHWRKRGLTETRAQSSQVGNHCSISLKRLLRVYIEISAKGKGQGGHRSRKMQNGPWQG